MAAVSFLTVPKQRLARLVLLTAFVGLLFRRDIGRSLPAPRGSHPSHSNAGRRLETKEVSKATIIEGRYFCPPTLSITTEGVGAELVLEAVESFKACQHWGDKLGLGLTVKNTPSTQDPWGCWAQGSQSKYTALHWNPEGTTDLVHGDRNVLCVETEEISTAFQVPDWKQRCEVNSTDFKPECLPDKLFERKDVHDWMFAEYCGVFAGSVRAANLLNKKSAHGQVYQLIYEQCLGTAISFIFGMATLGLFYHPEQERKEEEKKKEDKKKDDEEERGKLKGDEDDEETRDETKDEEDEEDSVKKKGKDGTLKARAGDIYFMCMSGQAALFAASAGLQSCLAFLGEVIEYFHGIYSLPSDQVSFSCKSLMSTEFLYYRDILGNLTMCSFSAMDLVTIGFMALTYCGVVLNTSGQVCCLTLGKCLGSCAGACLAALKACVPACLGYLKYVFTCQCCAPCCQTLLSTLKSCCACLCSTLKYCCTCQCFVACWHGFVQAVKSLCMCAPCKLLCETCKLACLGLCNLCRLCCWKCTLLTKCSCLCCLNVCCQELCVKASAAVAFLILVGFLPLLAYLGLGMLCFVLCIALSIAVFASVPLLGYYLVHETLTAASRLWGRNVLKQEEKDLPEHKGIRMYYGEFGAKVIAQAFEQAAALKNGWLDEEAMKAEEEKHRTLPKVLVDWRFRIDASTQQNPTMITFMPILFVLMLVGAGSVASSSTESLLRLTAARPDVAWAGGCVVDGVPSDPSECDKQARARFGSPASMFDDTSGKLLEIKAAQLRTVNGIKVPPAWPVFESELESNLKGRRRCDCLTCQGHAPLREDAVCGPLFTPGPSGAYIASAGGASEARGKVPMSCAKEESDTERRRMSRQNKTDLPGANGLGEGGMVLAYPFAWHSTTGLITVTEEHNQPVILNTYKLGGGRPREGCYGMQMPIDSAESSGDRLDGWCNCSSGTFVPTAFDRIKKVTRVPMGGTIHSNIIPKEAFISARTTQDSPIWTPEWLAQQQREELEWIATYGADESVGIQFTLVAGIRDAWVGFAAAITHLLAVVFNDTFIFSLKLLVYHFHDVVDWFRSSFFAAQNFANALFGWLKDSNAKDFNEMRDSVLLGRSMAAFSVGLATLVVATKAAATESSL